MSLRHWPGMIANTTSMEKISRIGFELECEVLDPGIDWQELGVTIGHDGSISHCDPKCRNDRSLYEFRSTPYVKLSYFEPFFKKIQKMADAGHFHVNPTMGFHVHVSFMEGTERDITVRPKTVHSPAFVKFFIERLKKELPEVYEKRGTNRYCALARPDEGKTVLDRVLNGSRYQAVNFQALRSHRTVEFRIFPADKPENLRKYLEFVQRTVNDFLATDDHRIHYSVKDKLPAMTIKDLNPEYVVYKPKKRNGKILADGSDNRLALTLQTLAYTKAKRGGYYSLRDTAGLGKYGNAYIPTYQVWAMRTTVKQKYFPAILARSKQKKVTVSTITK